MKNKVTKILALSVLGVFALTACDEVVAKPQQYSEPLIVATDYSEEIHNNIASVVYDAIHDGGVGSEVLNQILYLYAVNAFGAYNANVKVNNQAIAVGETTLEVAATTADQGVLDAFVLNHKAYWDPNRTDNTGAVSDTERQRVKAKYDTMEDRIAESMYGKISGGSYTDRHVFSEEKFLKSLKNSLESVETPASTLEYYKTQILPEVEPEDVFGNYLHRDYYYSDANSYVIDEIVPDLYRQLLAEQYLLEETYNTLGRSYARKVNIVKFANNSNYPNFAFYLANQLVSEINADPEVYKTSALGTNGVLARFKQYSQAEIGVVGSSTELAAILTNAGITKGVINTGSSTLDDELEAALGNFYLGTKYGDLSEKYIKMKDVAHYGVNSDYESTFSGSNAYPTYVGLEQEKLALKENDNTTTGWYVKNGGLTDLPESIRSRLFNIGVATGVKEKEADQLAMDRQYVSGEWKEAENENAYVCRINGHNYLKTASRVKGEKIDNDILHYDADSKTYYIVEIEEAVSASKLSKTSENNYAHTRSEEVMQDVINEVSKIVGQGESYSTLATKKYLKAMDIKYHDQSVYDYFKENYPELFDGTTTSSSEE